MPAPWPKETLPTLPQPASPQPASPTPQQAPYAGQGRLEPAQNGPVQLGAPQVGPGQVGLGPAPVGPGQVGPGQVDGRPGWPATLVAGGLMAASVGLHVAAMFPPYPGTSATPVAQVPFELTAYIVLEVGWALAALAVLTRLSVRGGVALGASLGAVEVGLLVTDLASGFLTSNGSAAGVWLAVAGLAAGLAGVLYGGGVVLSLPPGPTGPSQSPAGAGDLPSPAFAGPAPASSYAPAGYRSTRSAWASPVASPVRVVLSFVAAVVAVATFWPSWDHSHLVTTSGQVLNVGSGNAFSQPASVMAGEVLAGVAIGVAVVIASLWRDALVGAWAMGGAVIALASQVISGAVQVTEPIPKILGMSDPSQFDLSASKVSLTGYWYADLAAMVALALLAVWAAFDGLRARGRPAEAAKASGESQTARPTGLDWPSQSGA